MSATTTETKVRLSRKTDDKGACWYESAPLSDGTFFEISPLQDVGMFGAPIGGIREWTVIRRNRDYSMGKRVRGMFVRLYEVRERLATLIPETEAEIAREARRTRDELLRRSTENERVSLSLSRADYERIRSALVYDERLWTIVTEAAR